MPVACPDCLLPPLSKRNSILNLFFIMLLHVVGGVCVCEHEVILNFRLAS